MRTYIGCVGLRLQAEDVPPAVDRQFDSPRQLQLLVQEAAHLLRSAHVTEHPDLSPVTSDGSVARRQVGAPGAPAQITPHLQGTDR